VSASGYLRNVFFGSSNGIGRRMTVYIIAFSSSIMLVISAIQLVFEYRDLRRSLERELDTVNIYVEKKIFQKASGTMMTSRCNWLWMA
jgi:hypothetical protein